MIGPLEFQPAMQVGLSTVGGALVIGPGDPRVLVLGAPIALAGDLVADHGDSPHNAATLTPPIPATSVRVFGALPARAGELATCGHPQISTNTKVHIRP